VWVWVWVWVWMWMRCLSKDEKPFFNFYTQLPPKQG